MPLEAWKRSNQKKRRGRIKSWIVIASISLVAFFGALPVRAGAPLKTVESHVHKVLEVLKDLSLQGKGGKKAKKDKLWSIADAMFDYVELSRRTLGRHWEELSCAQQKEFARLFSRHLGNVYMDRILTYQDERIIFYRESMVAKQRAEVRSRVVSESKEIPVHYRMVVKDGTWKVYDVVVEGVSLVRNYRSQFNKILQTKSPEALLEILRKKLEES